MGRDDYSKTLTAIYDLKINWKWYTKGPSVAPNDGIAFTTDSEESRIHATNGMRMTQSGKPVVCHLCVKDHYSNR